jgi:N-acetylglucosaminyl-diphospho-decaprenol L-rhamnosyltransferase
MLKLSIIIVSYNSRAVLEELLNFLSTAKYAFGFEVIVIDNKSVDCTADMIRDNYPGIYLICNDKNVGFSGACNKGIGYARGEYALFLNPDTKIIGDALQKLVLCLDTHADAGVVTGRVVYPDMTDQGVARIFGRHSILTKLFPNNKYSRTYLTSRQHESWNPFEVDWVSGACLMVRKQILDDVGPFDEKFFMYWEDADLCYRIKKRGWRVFCVADAIIIHYEGKSSGKKTARLIIEFHKSAYHYYRKHHIKNTFGLKNLFALVGLTARALVLLLANSCQVSYCRRMEGVSPCEET